MCTSFRHRTRQYSDHRVSYLNTRLIFRRFVYFLWDLCLPQMAESEGAYFSKFWIVLEHHHRTNDRVWRCAFSTACSTSKAVCAADEARALMSLKWTRFITQQERTTPHKKWKIPYIFIGNHPLLFKIVSDSIKITPFLVRTRPNSMAPVVCYPPWVALGHRLWCRHCMLRSKAVF